jgi:hypothetical protein
VSGAGSRRRAWGLAAAPSADQARAAAAFGEGHRRAPNQLTRRAGPAAGALQSGVPRAPHRCAPQRRAGRRRHLLRRRAQGRRQDLPGNRDRLRQPVRLGTALSQQAAGHRVQLVNNDVLPAFEQHGAKVEAVLSDNGREFRGRGDQHPYELFLQLEGIEHKRTRVSRPQSNCILERLHRTLLDEHFRVEGARPGSRPSRRCRPCSMPTWSATIPGVPTMAAA